MKKSFRTLLLGTAVCVGLMTSGMSAVYAQDNGDSVVPSSRNSMLAANQDKNVQSAKDSAKAATERTFHDITENPTATMIQSASVTTSTKTNKVKKGDTVTLSVQGVPGVEAKAYLGRIVEIPLKEVAPGKYQASYKVRNAFTSKYDVYARLNKGDKHEVKQIGTVSITGLPAPTVMSIRQISGNGMWHALGHAIPGSYIAVDVTLDQNYLVTTSKRHCRMEGFADTFGNYVAEGEVGTDLFTKASVFVLTVITPSGDSATSEPHKLEFSDGGIGGAVTGFMPRLIPIPRL